MQPPPPHHKAALTTVCCSHLRYASLLSAPVWARNSVSAYLNRAIILPAWVVSSPRWQSLLFIAYPMHNYHWLTILSSFSVPLTVWISYKTLVVVFFFFLPLRQWCLDLWIILLPFCFQKAHWYTIRPCFWITVLKLWTFWQSQVSQEYNQICRLVI